MHKFFADIHCHPSLKAFYGSYPKPIYNMWDRVDHGYTDVGISRFVRKATKGISKASESNFDAMRAGNVRLAMISLTPLELGFLKLRNIPSMIMHAKSADYIVEYVAGYHIKKIEQIKKKKYNYFDDVQAEYDFLVGEQGKSPDGQSYFRIAKNYLDIVETLSDENGISVVLSIEGGHVLGCGMESTAKLPLEDHKKIIGENIEKIKGWEYPVFSMNLAHHFWNQLCGHSTSIKHPTRALINQNRGKDKPITELGKFAIKELLGTHNGRRIVIDTRHMSAVSRLQYFDFVDYHNAIHPKDKIPIISSHSGVNGHKTLQASIKQIDNKRKKNNTVFNEWSINLSDEEILKIHDSEGLIGIMLDEGKLAGDKVLENIKKIENPEKKKEETMKMFCRNIFHIAKVIGDKSGWDRIVIGSDYDGAITHVPPYHNSSTFIDLEKDLTDFIERKSYGKDYWFGYEPHEIIEKFMSTNALNFYRIYFNY